MKTNIKFYTQIFSATFGSLVALAVSLPAIAQESELDVDNLRAQLESSRSQSKEEAPAAKQQLDQQEANLMKKLDGLVEKEAKPIVVLEAPLESEDDKFESLSPQVQEESASKEVTVKAKISAEEKRTQGLEKSNSALTNKIAELQRRLTERSKELEETRNRLVIAETQVERLSGILEQENKAKMAGYLGKNNASTASNLNANGAVAAMPKAPVSSPLVNQVSNTRPSEESLVGIVVAQKAFLRSGPSKSDSPIMSVSKGTRLVVETRNNEWYRVITPTGGRAWIATQMLNFGPGAETGSGSALRIGGYEKSTR